MVTTHLSTRDRLSNRRGVAWARLVAFRAVHPDPRKDTQDDKDTRAALEDVYRITAEDLATYDWDNTRHRADLA
jgi:hypothetical protein